MNVQMPFALNMYQSPDFCCRLDSLPESDEYVFDYEKATTYDPFGMLLVGAKIRQFMNDRPDATYRDASFKDKTYAGHMGFFYSVRQAFGKEPGQALGSPTYVPVTELLLSDIRGEAEHQDMITQRVIQRHAARLANIVCERNKNLNECLTFSLRELMRNVDEHSRAHSIWVAAQYWQSRDLVEIAILDEGVGIQTSLAVNRRLSVRTNEDALRLAIEPGVTKSPMLRNDRNPWSNSGFGLYMTSSICQFGGKFIMCSGNSALIVANNRTSIIPSSIRGTAIGMSIRVSKITQIDEMLKAIAERGERRAKENRRNVVLSASKVSRLPYVD